MKLLTKQEISDKKTQERKLEVDEGIKLARKVDKLREMAVSEESNLAKFREENMRLLKESIEALTGQRDFLQNNIMALQEEKRELLVPLDKEWRKVRAIEDRLAKFGEELNEKHIQLQNTEMEYDLKVEKLKEERSRLKDDREGVSELIKEAKSKLKEAKDILETSNSKKEEIERHIKIEYQELTKKEAEISTREKNNKLKESSLLKLADDLAKKDRQINDKYETLQRSITRLKK